MGMQRNANGVRRQPTHFLSSTLYLQDLRLNTFYNHIGALLATGSVGAVPGFDSAYVLPLTSSPL